MGLFIGGVDTLVIEKRMRKRKRDTTPENTLRNKYWYKAGRVIVRTAFVFHHVREVVL